MIRVVSLFAGCAGDQERHDSGMSNDTALAHSAGKKHDGVTQPICESLIYDGMTRCYFRASWHCPTHGWRCGYHAMFQKSERICKDCGAACDLYWNTQQHTSEPMCAS